MLVAAQNDEAINRILPKLKDAIHEHCETLSLVVTREYPFQKDDMAAD
jgi:hypothetical protein